MGEVLNIGCNPATAFLAQDADRFQHLVVIAMLAHEAFDPIEMFAEPLSGFILLDFVEAWRIPFRLVLWRSPV